MPNDLRLWSSFFAPIANTWLSSGTDDDDDDDGDDDYDDDDDDDDDDYDDDDDDDIRHSVNVSGFMSLDWHRSNAGNRFSPNISSTYKRDLINYSVQLYLRA